MTTENQQRIPNIKQTLLSDIQSGHVDPIELLAVVRNSNLLNKADLELEIKSIAKDAGVDLREDTVVDQLVNMLANSTDKVKQVFTKLRDFVEKLEIP
jgi:predicted regulator of amino acid metabolism with ACT domain